MTDDAFGNVPIGGPECQILLACLRHGQIGGGEMRAAFIHGLQHLIDAVHLDEPRRNAKVVCEFLNQVGFVPDGPLPRCTERGRTFKR